MKATGCEGDLTYHVCVTGPGWISKRRSSASGSATMTSERQATWGSGRTNSTPASRISPVADEILIRLARADLVGDDRWAECPRQRLRRRDPAVAADAGQHGELAAAGEIEARYLLALGAEEPDMRQPRAGPSRRLVVQFGITFEGGFRPIVGYHGAGLVALVHLDAAASLS